MKLHELLRAGIDALKEFEQRDDCVVDMGEWTRPAEDEHPCFACLGGAYYIKSMGIDIQDSELNIGKRVITPEEMLLDHLRMGHASLAMCYAQDLPPSLPVYTHLDRDVADYHKARDQFYEDMETLYTDLKNEDL